jgi:hypothetical protein
MASSVLKAARLVGVGIVMTFAGRTLAGAATQDAFQPVGNLVQDRDGAQVTLLKDGTVLVTGGNHYVGSTNFNAILASAELFDPKTNKFTAVGDMTSPRNDSHRALLLNDGRVLITGGSATGKTQLRSAELYDPATRAFTAVGDMNELRAAQSTTLLPNGQVLAAGGYDDNTPGPTAGAELFNPVTGMFQPTGRLRTKRYRHSAVPLPDGRVLILGGFGATGQALRSVEIYDPATGQFVVQGNLVEARADLAATLLPDGRILVVGGKITNAQGQPDRARTSVEIFDPATGQSAITDSLIEGRDTPVAAPLPNGQVLVAGGALTAGNVWTPLSTAVMLDSNTGKASRTVSMTVARAYTSGVALPDGRVLIVGGDGGTDGSSLNTAEVFVPGTASANAP